MLLALAAGGTLGALCRYALALSAPTGGVPAGTLVAKVTGGLALGLLVGRLTGP